MKKEGIHVLNNIMVKKIEFEFGVVNYPFKCAFCVAINVCMFVYDSCI